MQNMGKISKENKQVISKRYSLLVKAISSLLPWPCVPLGTQLTLDLCQNKKSYVYVGIRS
jgi:hypothetical protein